MPQKTNHTLAKNACVFTAGLFFASLSQAAPIDSYETELKSALQSIEKKAPRPEIIEKSKTLIKLADPLVTDFLKTNPSCADYLRKAAALPSIIDTLNLEKIETGYHRDGALPKASRACYHVKDLIVHPATVWIVARDLKADTEAYPKMNNELAEVLGHLAEVRKSLKP